MSFARAPLFEQTLALALLLRSALVYHTLNNEISIIKSSNKHWSFSHESHIRRRQTCLFGLRRYSR